MNLRHVVLPDLEAFFLQQCEVATQRMAGFTARERDAFMTHWKTKILANPSARTRTLVVDDEIAGYVTSWDSGDHRLVAYVLGQRFWGRGLATRALSRFLLDDELVRPLHATVAPQNDGSVRVLEKCGFTRVTDEHERAALLGEGEEEGLVLTLR